MNQAPCPPSGLRWVVALPCEAQPLIRRHALEPVAGSRPYRVYRDPPGNHWLIVAGVGRENAGLATAYLSGLSAACAGPASAWTCAWLNVGVAGHDRLPLGEVRAAHKITDADSGRSSYPPVLFTSLKTASLLTVPEPAEELPADTLVDMEGSAFHTAATTFASPELVHCVKIVSDQGVTRGERVSKQTVSALITESLPLLDTASTQLATLARELSARHTLPSHFDSLSQRFHFSATQLGELQTLLRRWEVLLGQREDVLAFVEKKRRPGVRGRDVLTSLADRLNSVPLTLAAP